MSERVARLAGVVAAAFGLGFALVFSRSPSALGQSPSPVPSPALSTSPADCRLVDGVEAARIVGYPLGAPDESAARGGICFFAARSLSQEGSLSYALVTLARIPERRAYFIAAARRCGSVATGSSNESICRAYRRLAEASDLTAYFKARTDFADAVAIANLGDEAIVAPDAVYVRRADVVYECVVRRGETIDVERSTQLARLLLARAETRARRQSQP